MLPPPVIADWPFAGVVTLVVAESFSAQAAAAGASGQLALVVVSQP